MTALGAMINPERLSAMRFGSILIGFFLAIALAYAHDASVAPVSAEGQPQIIVN